MVQTDATFNILQFAAFGRIVVVNTIRWFLLVQRMFGITNRWHSIDGITIGYENSMEFSDPLPRLSNSINRVRSTLTF